MLWKLEAAHALFQRQSVDLKMARKSGRKPARTKVFINILFPMIHLSSQLYVVVGVYLLWGSGHRPRARLQAARDLPALRPGLNATPQPQGLRLTWG